MSKPTKKDKRSKLQDKIPDEVKNWILEECILALAECLGVMLDPTSVYLMVFLFVRLTRLCRRFS